MELAVEHEDYDGSRRVSTFKHHLARLVAHQMDHLDGLLYTDHMGPESRLVPVGHNDE